MPTLQVFDRINRLDSEGNNLYVLKSMPYEQYFGEMTFLTKEEKEALEQEKKDKLEQLEQQMKQELEQEREKHNAYLKELSEKILPIFRQAEDDVKNQKE